MSSPHSMEAPLGSHAPQHSYRARARRFQWPLLALFTTVVLGLLVLCIIMASGYRNVVTQRDADNTTRAALSSLASSVKAADSVGALGSMDGPEGDVLVLADQEGGYETRIYLYQGHLVSEYVASSARLSPSTAVELATTTTFSFEYVSDNLLAVSTDEGTRYICLHSGQGGEAHV